MKRFTFLCCRIILINSAVVLFASTPSENAVDLPDTSTAVVQPKPEPESTDESGELILGEIEIKGNVEKPGVYVMPKRIEPELEEMQLGRSFQNELKDGAMGVPKPGNTLSEVDKVGSIKQALEKKRN